MNGGPEPQAQAWALGVGRLGSILGPVVGGLAVAQGLTEARELFLLPLAPLALAAVAALVLTRIQRTGHARA